MYTKQQIIDRIAKEKLIVILRGVDKEKLIPLVQAMYEGGIRLLEITYNPSRPETDAQTAEQIDALVKRFGDKMLIGAGTVLTKKQVVLTHKAGGSFIISPNTDKSIIGKTCKLGMVSIPGALTPSECVLAHNVGADFVKLFPVSDMGSAYLKALKAPLSHIRFLAVGGVNAQNAQEYLRAGASGVGIGSCLADKKLIAEGNFEKLAESSKTFVDAIKNA